MAYIGQCPILRILQLNQMRMSKITLQAHMIQLLLAEKFKKLANELESNKQSKGIDSCTHLVNRLFCHLSNGLMSIAGNINQLGCKQAPCN